MPPFQFLFAIALASPESLVDQLRQSGAQSIQLKRIQLDADSPLEAVVQYELPETGVHAVVLDQQSGEWRETGRFNSWWNYTDLLVKTRSGGTEDARTTLEIFRLKAGVMVPVLSFKEEETAMEHPSGDVFTTTTRIHYSPGRVTVKSSRDPGARETCQSYLWNAARYRFEEADGCP